MKRLIILVLLCLSTCIYPDNECPPNQLSIETRCLGLAQYPITIYGYFTGKNAATNCPIYWNKGSCTKLTGIPNLENKNILAYGPIPLSISPEICEKHENRPGTQQTSGPACIYKDKLTTYKGTLSIKAGKWAYDEYFYQVFTVDRERDVKAALDSVARLTYQDDYLPTKRIAIRSVPTNEKDVNGRPLYNGWGMYLYTKKKSEE